MSGPSNYTWFKLYMWYKLWYEPRFIFIKLLIMFRSLLSMCFISGKSFFYIHMIFRSKFWHWSPTGTKLPKPVINNDRNINNIFKIFLNFWAYPAPRQTNGIRSALGAVTSCNGPAREKPAFRSYWAGTTDNWALQSGTPVTRAFHRLMLKLGYTVIQIIIQASFIQRVHLI